MTFEEFVDLVKKDATNHPAVAWLGQAIDVLEREHAGYQAQAAQAPAEPAQAPAPAGSEPAPVLPPAPPEPPAPGTF